MYFDTIALMKAQTSVPLNTEFIVGGHSNAGDGGGGTFIYIDLTPPPELPDDDGIIIHAIPPNIGYFQRLFSGPINVRWFGATGLGITDDTTAVHKARDSVFFAKNGTLFFPRGTYVGAFIFDFQDNDHNETNIKGDGHGTILMSNASGNPVVTLGYRTIEYPSNNWMWSRISDLTIIGRNDNTGHQPSANGIELSNPTHPDLDSAAGRWVMERILFMRCLNGVYKKDGNLGNHFIDCTWNGNDVGVWMETAPVDGANGGSDRFSGCSFEGHTTACLRYFGAAPQLIIDGTTFEYNYEGWAIWIELAGTCRMAGSGISIRNVWFEGNGTSNGEFQVGGDLNLVGVRSVRIDDSGITGRMHLRDSSVTLYNCKLSSNPGGATGDAYIVDRSSSLVAYEHKYDSYPPSQLFVNSISYDGSQDINHESGHLGQPTSVWGPLRCLTSTKVHEIPMSTHFDMNAEPFEYQAGGSGNVFTTVEPMRVLGNGSGRLSIVAGDNIKSVNTATIGSYASSTYVVWSIHSYLHSHVPEGHHIEELTGEIKTKDISLGRVYFKYDQWACSYGMKLVDTPSPLEIYLEFKTAYPAAFFITDYQIITFDSLHGANSYVNSREFTISVPGK